jgi:hypothetical protein
VGTPDARELKRMLGPSLLAIDGVSGVGVPAGRLTVYLERDEPSVRRQVEDVVKRLAPNVTVAFEKTGRFRPQS